MVFKSSLSIKNYININNYYDYTLVVYTGTHCTVLQENWLVSFTEPQLFSVKNPASFISCFFLSVCLNIKCFLYN